VVYSPGKGINEHRYSASSIFRRQQWADSDERATSHSTFADGQAVKLSKFARICFADRDRSFFGPYAHVSLIWHQGQALIGTHTAFTVETNVVCNVVVSCSIVDPCAQHCV
jgi:hypothetical protein